MSSEKHIEKITIDKVSHIFKCDNCGITIGVSEEYDDGYYSELGVYELHMHFYKNHYHYKKNLCPQCKNETEEKFKKLLTDFGFE